MSAGGDEGTAWGQGSRRRKFAGYLKAANELRQNYQASYNEASARGQDGGLEDDGMGIPGSFPDLKVARNGDEEMVLFPSYARRHVKSKRKEPPRNLQSGNELATSSDPGDADYWKREWEIYEDANAIVDVDIRGWIYSPHRGPMNRKNRLMMGIARKLSGIPAPGESQPSSRSSSRIRDRHEDEMVEREAQNISQKGQLEADVAGRGGYSEGRYNNSGSSSRNPSPKPGDLQHPVTGSSLSIERAEKFSSRTSWSQPADMSPEELKTANHHLLSRLKPFLTNPSIGMSLTVFFYNDKSSQSRTTRTNESGHFNLRAALDFVPTQVRVLASESLSATEEVIVTEPHGVSLISDIDDTIKHSAIGAGAREIFRNAFIRELGDLTIDGVEKWYNKMSEMGVKMHYVSNSPWQMYPLLDSYFIKAGLPPGSFHLKQYSGMLQGIFEPVAERKRGTLDRILEDFPERRFILVGDSGEADLEVYTETAIMNPGRILGIFIRDVTTSPKHGFFDPSNGGQSSKPPFQPRPTKDDNKSESSSNSRPALPPRPGTVAAIPKVESDIGDLIDFSSDSEPQAPSRTQTEPAEEPLSRVKSSTSTKPSPPVPRKPVTLRTKSNEFPTESSLESNQPLPVIRKPAPPTPAKPSQLSNGKPTTSPQDSLSSAKKAPPPLPPDRAGYRASAMNRLNAAYNSLPPAPSFITGRPTSPSRPAVPSPQDSSAPRVPSATKPNPPPSRTSTNSSIASSTSAAPATLFSSSPYADQSAPPPPPRRGLASYPAAAASYASAKWYGTEEQVQDSSGAIVSKKEELWKRRWARAEEVCKKKGVVLKTWRVGTDIMKEAVRLVENAQKEDKKSVTKGS